MWKQLEQEVLGLWKEQIELVKGGKWMCIRGKRMTCYREIHREGYINCCAYTHATNHSIKRKRRKTGEANVWQHFPMYLNKNVYESQRHYDNEEDGRAGNDNYNGGERNEYGAQQHEHSGWESLVYHIDVLGEAVDNASYRCGVKERLGRVKFVEE